MVSTRRRRAVRNLETSDFLAMVARMLAAGGRRVSEGDPADFKRLLELRAQLDVAIVDAVRGMRDNGITWEDIGAAAGTTRQAAIMRWNPKL